MALLVDEVMNRELFSTRPDELAHELTNYFSILGINSSPVLGADGALLGMISLRDLSVGEWNARVQDLMRAPVVTVAAKSSIEEAARLMSETGFHRLPVVDSQQRVVGIVSSLDVLRGLIGMPARHPETFPHYDQETGLIWSDDMPLEFDRVEAAPRAPGLIAIVSGGVGKQERVVWAEMTHSIRDRVIDIFSLPQENHPSLWYWMQKPPLRFRFASLEDETIGRRVVDKLQREAGLVPQTLT